MPKWEVYVYLKDVKRVCQSDSNHWPVFYKEEADMNLDFDEEQDALDCFNMCREKIMNCVSVDLVDEDGCICMSWSVEEEEKCKKVM